MVWVVGILLLIIAGLSYCVVYEITSEMTVKIKLKIILNIIMSSITVCHKQNTIQFNVSYHVNSFLIDVSLGFY